MRSYCGGNKLAWFHFECFVWQKTIPGMRLELTPRWLYRVNETEIFVGNFFTFFFFFSFYFPNNFKIYWMLFFQLFYFEFSFQWLSESSVSSISNFFYYLFNIVLLSAYFRESFDYYYLLNELFGWWYCIRCPINLNLPDVQSDYYHKSNELFFVILFHRIERIKYSQICVIKEILWHLICIIIIDSIHLKRPFNYSKSLSYVKIADIKQNFYM